MERIKKREGHIVLPNIWPGPTWLQPHIAAARCGLRLRLARAAAPTDREEERYAAAAGASRALNPIFQSIGIQVCELEIAAGFEAFRREGSAMSPTEGGEGGSPARGGAPRRRERRARRRGTPRRGARRGRRPGTRRPAGRRVRAPPVTRLERRRGNSGSGCRRRTSAGSWAGSRWRRPPGSRP